MKTLEFANDEAVCNELMVLGSRLFVQSQNSQYDTAWLKHFSEILQM